MASETLALPCTLAQLHEFINHIVDADEASDEATAQVTYSAPNLTVT
jgi:hypothetical protein